jgi:hypothetical protein
MGLTFRTWIGNGSFRPRHLQRNLSMQKKKFAAANFCDRGVKKWNTKCQTNKSGRIGEPFVSHLSLRSFLDVLYLCSVLYVPFVALLLLCTFLYTPFSNLFLYTPFFTIFSLCSFLYAPLFTHLSWRFFLYTPLFTLLSLRSFLYAPFFTLLSVRTVHDAFFFTLFSLSSFLYTPLFKLLSLRTVCDAPFVTLFSLRFFFFTLLSLRSILYAPFLTLLSWCSLLLFFLCAPLFTLLCLHFFPDAPLVGMRWKCKVVSTQRRNLTWVYINKHWSNFLNFATSPAII